MGIDFYNYSNQGERPVNEDSVGAYNEGNYYIFSLCDGLGGHGNGEIASQTAVKEMINTALCFKGDEAVVEKSFECANAAVIKEQQRDGSKKDMKTTGTLLIIDNGMASWGHIGDSRIYYFRKSKYIKRTLDHSIPQMLVATGEIKEKDIRHHEDRNRLLRCIPWDGKKYDVDEKNFQLQKGDSFLMMSDGFWDWVDEKMMHKCLKKGKTAQESAQLMIDLAFKYGRGNNMDNLSLIVVKID